MSLERGLIMHRELGVSPLAVLLLVTAAVLPRLSGAVATDLSLMPPMNLTIELDPEVDAQQWAQTHGLEDAEQREQSDGSTLLNFHMPDDEWAMQSQDLCGTPGVMGCGVNHCREFLAPSTSGADFSGRVSDIAGGPVAGARIMLVPKAPEVSEFVTDEKEDESDDQSISLNLRPGKRRCDYDQGAGLGPVMASADGSGGFDLGLPGGGAFDSGCWELKAANACEAQSLPTRTIMPEFEPKRVLVLLPGAANKDAQATRDTANALGLAVGLSVLEVLPLQSLNSTLVRFEVGSQGGAGAQAATLALSADPRVDATQPEYRYRVSATDTGDPYGWMNYGAEQIGAERLQAVATGEGVMVAVIDTGVDTTHPELADRIDEEIDVSGFGTSPDRHGTAIAGIIAAESGNGIGSYGVAPATKIFAIKACEPETPTGISARCWSSTIAKALDVALTSDAAIINMSLGGPEDPLVTKLLDKAAEQGVLVIASAGNDGPDAPPPFPASHPAVMAITAVDANNKPYARAVRGEFVDAAAPGVEIAVPAPGETYPSQLSGTSMAAAYVSGAAALLFSIEPDATADSVRAGLQGSAVNPTGSTRDPVFGHGRIDVCAAADSISAGQTTCPATTSP
jgi:hypothetical protein